MKFSMNGFRRQLSNDVKSLKDIVELVINESFYDKDDLVEAVNDVITHSNVVNCVYNDNDPDFIEMSDVEIDHLEPST